MRETKERLKQTQKKHNIVQALKNMDSSELMESFDSFLFEVKSKVAHAEARLDVALESLETEGASSVREAENDEILKKQRAKETLKQLRNEMGLLYSELERQADEINVNKTIGRSGKINSEDPSAS